MKNFDWANLPLKVANSQLASEGEDELDVMKRRTEGIRKSNRAKTQPKPFFGSATIASDQIVLEMMMM